MAAVTVVAPTAFISARREDALGNIARSTASSTTLEKSASVPVSAAVWSASLA